ncbi:hypothetical protein GCM10025857_32990 [Alicyclobacillus contaminans]|uniref:post-transcriptional regulator n=1 Tax=Alicyclobacillus contaminans TaxID=392016 RepID=UPI000421A16B|nr:post-transcriptional regulator [Alicyclobacillus contaminans]GMA51942.1 hypothetical protein GCM10025857_32990 [Alicyclobacillus contaminans]
MEHALDPVFDWDSYLPDLLPLCEAKAEEFRSLGYHAVTADEVLGCARSMFRETPMLHQAVAAILGLNIGRFMSHATVSAWRRNPGNDSV